jgi:hypothetical protein
MTAPTAFSALMSVFNKTMNHEDILKEMHKTIQAMICVTMTHESLCATSRAVATVANVVYEPYTMLKCLELINRPAHSAHVAAVSAE